MIMRGKLGLKFGAAALALSMGASAPSFADESKVATTDGLSGAAGDIQGGILRDIHAIPMKKTSNPNAGLNLMREKVIHFTGAAAKVTILDTVSVPFSKAPAIEPVKEVVEQQPKLSSPPVVVIPPKEKKAIAKKETPEKPVVTVAPKNIPVEAPKVPKQAVAETSKLKKPAVAFNHSNGKGELGVCAPSKQEQEYFATVFMDDDSGTQGAALIDLLARKISPLAHSGENVIAKSKGGQKGVRELQRLLMRTNCYGEYGRQDDGGMGAKTQKAILNFVDAYKNIYANLESGLIYKKAISAKTAQSKGTQLVGVKSRVMKALADVAAKRYIFTTQKIEEANKNENIHSYNLAVYKELRGDFLGQAKPNYVQLRITARDIDVMGRTLYGEVRGEGDKGRRASAFTILNRTMTRILDDSVSHAQFKKTLAGSCQAKYQYSTWNRGDVNYKKITNLKANGKRAQDRLFRKLKRITKDGVIAVDGVFHDPVKGADHYHTNGLYTKWSSGKRQHVKPIGNHVFFNLLKRVTRMNSVLQKVKPLVQKIDALHDKNKKIQVSLLQSQALNIKKAPKRAP